MNKKEIWQEEREAEKGLGDLFASLQLTPNRKKHQVVKKKRAKRKYHLDKKAKAKALRDLNKLFQ